MRVKVSYAGMELTIYPVAVRDVEDYYTNYAVRDYKNEVSYGDFVTLESAYREAHSILEKHDAEILYWAERRDEALEDYNNYVRGHDPDMVIGLTEELS